MLRLRPRIVRLLALPASLALGAALHAQLLAPPRPTIVMPEQAPAAGAPSQAPQPHGCLATGNGYLRAEIRGARNLDLNWSNAELECDGGPRPTGSGLRLAFAGPPLQDGHRLRLVFGVARVHEGKGGRELPTNLTVIFEGEQRLFATRGDDHCTVDQLRQERLGDVGAKRRWRVVARGFCVSPASTLNSDARLLVSKFDFAGSVTFGEDPPDAAHH
jgi:hypothetical protein